MEFVWFLAPTVALASQQHDVIATQLPAFPTRFLSGADGVDHWSEQQIWDDVLAGIRIVVSTHQVQMSIQALLPEVLYFTNSSGTPGRTDAWLRWDVTACATGFRRRFLSE